MNYAGEQSAVGPLSGGGLRAASGTGDWEQCHSEHPHTSVVLGLYTFVTLALCGS